MFAADKDYTYHLQLLAKSGQVRPLSRQIYFVESFYLCDASCAGQDCNEATNCFYVEVLES